MKKTLLFWAFTLSVGTCLAQTHQTFKITVSDFQFSPSLTNAKVGDSILFVWKSGNHTTTSVSIPANAKPWDHPMNSTSKKFRYVVKKTGTYKYQCTFHFSIMTGKIKVTTALAAGLSDLNVDTKNANAILNWQVKDNSQVSYFSIQRSTDGNNFTEIARVQPSSLNKYMYTDEAALTDKYVYYQLELTDKKGDTQLSDIKMFTNTKGSSKLITSISPNPLKSPGHLMLQFNAETAGKMHVQLFTQSGKLVTETDMTADKGLNNGHFHLGELTPGTYYIVCTLGNKSEKHTIIYQ